MRIFDQGDRWDLLCGFIAGIAMTCLLLSTVPGLVGLKHAVPDASCLGARP